MKEIGYYYPQGHEAHFEPDHPDRPARVEVIRQALISNGLWIEDNVLSPINLPEAFIQAVHTSAYLNILELTCRRGGHLDGDTYTTPASWSLAHNSAGGAAAIAGAVWDGKIKRGFALCRPPGHHAMKGQGMGFCLLNNIAIAAEFLIRVKNAKRIAIIDLDLHHGNGTQDIFWERGDVLSISIHQSPLYPGTGMLGDIGVGQGKGWTVNLPLPPGSGDEAYQSIVNEIIIPLLDQRSPEMILVSYGFDPHWKDPLGQLLLTANGYGELIRTLCEWSDNHCAGRLALFLEGGYDLDAAKACGVTVVSAMQGKRWEDPLPSPFKESNEWHSIVEKAQVIWGL